MAVARRGFVSIDCADPLPLAEFWAAMLGGEIMFTTDETAGVRTEWVWLSAMKVSDYAPPTWPDGEVPKQIHLDLAVEDLDAGVAEALRLGARLSSVQPAPDHWRVLIDPAVGTNLLGLIRHLTAVEEHWFQRVFLGQDRRVDMSMDVPASATRGEVVAAVSGAFA